MTPLSFRRAARLATVVVALLMSVVSAAEPTRRFEIPAAEAPEALARFADQADSEILFSPAALRGIRTNAVSGRYPVREALDLLVAGTGLVANRDPAGGVLAVRRGAPDPNADRAERANAAGRPAAASDPGTAVQLSPFVLTTDRDRGYAAGSTLAGSRLQTPLQDVAAQISVFTPELMSDLGLANLEEVYLYSTNVEGYLEYTPGGDRGVGFGVLDVGNNNRIRGLGAVTVLRNFFETSLDLDAFNTERVSIASGPNAILFGLGNPGGITDGSLKSAGFRPRTVLAYRRDNFAGHRATLDSNFVLAPQRAALRLLALDANNRTFRKTNDDVNRRLHGTATWRPLPATTVRMHAEWADREASRASMIPVHDYVTPWLDGGRPAFDNAGINGATPAATLTTRIATGGLAPVFTRNGNASLVYVTGNSPANQPVSAWLNTVNVVGAHTRARTLQDQAYEWSLVRPDVYDPYANIYGTGHMVRVRGRVLNAFVEQRITRDLQLEAGFMRERAVTRQGSWIDGNNSFDVFVDGNRLLPDGATLNPNFGKLYSQTNPLGTRSYDDRQELRLTAAYDLDFTRRQGRIGWLGRHRLAAMVSDSDFRTTAQASRLIVAGTPAFLTPAARANLGDASRLLVVRTYLGNGLDHVIPPVPGGALDFKPTLAFNGPGGEPVEARMYDNPDGSYAAATGTVRNVISRSLADQAYLLKDRLIATYGWRESRVRMKTSLDAASTTRRANGMFPALGDTRFANAWDNFANGQSINWGLVGRPWRWLSIHYADSANFAVQEATWFDPFGTPIPGSNGEGRDYGASVHLADGKLSLRVNRFVNDQRNSRPDNIVSALRTIPMNIERRILQVAPATPLQGMDLTRYGNANYQVTNTSEATGYDIELTVNPSPNWRGMLNVGRQRTVTQIDDTWWRWVEQRLPVWRTFGAGWDVERYTATSAQSVRQMYDQWVATQRDPLVATDGIVVANQREWRVNGVLTYAFTEGRLRGATAGLGGRWRSANALGYALTTLPAGQSVLDLKRPYAGEAELAVDAFASWSLRRLTLLRLKSDWKLQLNVRNLLDRRGLIPTQVLTDGTPSIFTYRTPRQVIVSLQVEL